MKSSKRDCQKLYEKDENMKPQEKNLTTETENTEKNIIFLKLCELCSFYNCGKVLTIILNDKGGKNEFI